MRISQTRLLVAFASLALLASVPLVTAQETGIEYGYASGMASLTTDDIGVKVTAFNQVPHFQWWNESSPGKDYHIMFLKLFEANDTNGDGAFDPEVDRLIGDPYLLPTSNWDFSGFEVTEEESVVTEVHFNFTTNASFIPSLPELPFGMPEMFDVTIQIRVHMDMASPQEMKFDIVILGWTWAYDDSVLVFQLTVTESVHGAPQGTTNPAGISQQGNRFDFNEGYMTYAEEAQAGQSVVTVKGSLGEGTGEEAGESIYLTFEHFGEEILEYDPTLGITPGEGLSIFGIDYNQLLLLIGGASVVILAVILMRIKR